MKHSRKVVYLIGFLFSISLAITSYVTSSFLETFINVDYIGFLYAVSAIITIIALLDMPRLMAKYGNKNTTLFSIGLCFVSLLILAFSGIPLLVIPAFIIYFTTGNLLIANFDIFIEECSKTKEIGALRGFYLMITNVAWVIAVMISGSIIDKSSYTGIFLFAAGIIALVAGTIILFFGGFKDPVYKKVSIRKTIAFFRENKNISKIYLISLILKFFYAWMVIYTPIYLHQYLGFSWDTVGHIFTIMLLPFVILDVPLGRMSDKIGEKKLLLYGFIIITLFVLLIPLTNTTHWIVWALILFGTRVVAATIETMSEIYFFKKVSDEKLDEIAFFRNTSPISYILAPLLAVPILLYIPSFRFIFYVLGAIMLVGFLITLRLRDAK